MPHELEPLVAERESARFTFILARLARDTPARYLDAVIDDFTAIRAAWDALTVKQEEMDRAARRCGPASRPRQTRTDPGAIQRGNPWAGLADPRVEAHDLEWRPTTE